ncbi:hypothetical protein FB45DRAFT_1110321 [Roridomyces roridus]|uniref:C2H2-type domain-containing protein n=1 Tax=Roridomyces roridus TaxID=1738132 RepID=A0AAD7BAB6_9AGAR|nr:hypothetical protein FB45DRAFT_1110321 [Roridomyces roridus]
MPKDIARKPKKRTGSCAPPTKPRQFPCPEADCPWSFQYKDVLKRHGLQHLDEQTKQKHRHMCPEEGCEYGYLQLTNLRIHHETVHLGMKPAPTKKARIRRAQKAALLPVDAVETKSATAIQSAKVDRESASGVATTADAHFDAYANSDFKGRNLPGPKSHAGYHPEPASASARPFRVLDNVQVTHFGPDTRDRPSLPGMKTIHGQWQLGIPPRQRRRAISLRELLNPVNAPGKAERENARAFAMSCI